MPGSGRRWFQLYLWKDREASKDLLERAQKEGFDTLLVSADTRLLANACAIHATA